MFKNLKQFIYLFILLLIQSPKNLLAEYLSAQCPFCEETFTAENRQEIQDYLTDHIEKQHTPNNNKNKTPTKIIHLTTKLTIPINKHVGAYEKLLDTIDPYEEFLPIETPLELIKASPDYNQKLIKKHIKKYSKKHNCPCCNNKYLSLMNLIKHLEKQHSEFYFCIYQDCCKYFQTKEELIEHIQTHINEKPRQFICPSCGKKYKKKYWLNEHIYQKHT